jgi:CheY-like chemotaxis protein/two-component sensor histidine kinase
LESGALPLHLVQGDIIWFLQYLSESVRSISEAKGIFFHFLSEDSALVMDYDPEKLTRVVLNLLSNANKFTPEGGNIYSQITHERNQKDPRITIRVKDTGVGIAPDELPKIFDRFYQVDDSTTRIGEGTGIGLTLASEMTKAMHGEINVSSNPGKGTTFTVTLPIEHNAPLVTKQEIPGIYNFVHAESGEGTSDQFAEKETGGNAQAPTALIVEDNADVLQYLIRCLESDYQIILAMDGQEGTEKAMEYIPDIVVSDVMMPVKDGLELCDTLKQDVRTSHIPIILLTAKADMESRLQGISRGADAYLAKPFDRSELMVQMEALILARLRLRDRYRNQTTTTSDEQDLQIEDAFILRFTNAVEKNIDDENYGVLELCRDLNISRAQLHRKMTALTGKSTTQFHKTLRLRKANTLLLEGKLSIAEVAYATGFRDPSYFTKMFQAEFGMLPSAVAPHHM